MYAIRSYYAFVKDHNFGSWMDMLLMGKINNGGGWVAINFAASSKRLGHVVVVGGGYGGATAAKYLRLWSQGTVDVTLIERNPAFVSCPMFV